MQKFRFVTPRRKGKWYPSLQLAQRFAEAIGAGFLDRRTKRFVIYPEAHLEVLREEEKRKARPEASPDTLAEAAPLAKDPVAREE